MKNWMKHKVATGAIYRSFFNHVKQERDKFTLNGNVETRYLGESVLALIDVTEEMIRQEGLDDRSGDTKQSTPIPDEPAGEPV